MAAFIASFFLVFLAEMGDKTQLVAISFATRYSATKVLLAVFLATLLNHALAVLAGHFLAAVIPLRAVSLIAAISFIFFGLWTLRGDKLDNKNHKESRFGPVFTVATVFFLAEMGDKTQLTTLSLATEHPNMIAVLAGSTLGMVAADAIGVVVGVVLKKSLPEKAIKWFAACVFLAYGIIGVFQALR